MDRVTSSVAVEDEADGQTCGESPWLLDRFLLSRLLLGALSEEEQRQLLVRLLRADAVSRREIKPFLEPFVVDEAGPFRRGAGARSRRRGGARLSTG
jgi:hypothetical protein